MEVITFSYKRENHIVGMGRGGGQGKLQRDVSEGRLESMTGSWQHKGVKKKEKFYEPNFEGKISGENALTYLENQHRV